MTSVLKTVCSLLHNKLIFQKLPEIGDFFAVNRKKIIAESWSCVWLLFSGVLSYIGGVAAGVLGRGLGFGVLFRRSQKGQSSWSLGQKKKSGRFLVGGRHMCCPLL